MNFFIIEKVIQLKNIVGIFFSLFTIPYLYLHAISNIIIIPTRTLLSRRSYSLHEKINKVSKNFGGPKYGHPYLTTWDIIQKFIFVLHF